MRKYSKLMAILLAVAMILPGVAQAAETNDADMAIRLGGNSRVATSIEVSQEAYPEGAKEVVIAGWNGGADALTGTLLANAKDAPVLFTHPTKMKENLIDELDRLNAEKVYVLGGETVVSQSIVTTLEEKDLEVERVAGENRAKTAVAAAQKSGKATTHVFLANGFGDLVDALAAGSASAKESMPILLTEKNRVPASTLAAIEALEVTHVTILGGEGAVSPAVEAELEDYTVDRVGGTSRLRTAIAIADKYFADSTNAIVANGYGSPDALVGGYLGAIKDAPILLTDVDTINDAVTMLGLTDIEKVWILGEEEVVSKAVKDKIKEGLVKEIEDLTVKSVSAIDDIEVVFDGTYELPLEVEVSLSDNRTVTVPVTWDDSAVEINKAGTYQLVGILDISALGNVAGTDLTASVNVVVAPRVDVESILLSHTELTLIEGESISLSATVLPENATNKNLLWSSSDENIATVNEHGVVQTDSAGEATITVTNTLGNVTNDVIVTVKKPTIDSIEDITTHITQYDTYTLPTTVEAAMSNGTIEEYTINWLDDNIDTSILDDQYFEGTVEGYEQSITLTLVVKEYEPQILTTSYSSVTINGLSKSLSLRIDNNGTKPVNIEKIEVYQKGKLYTTYTPQALVESGISTVVQPKETWGISISYKLGIWLDNSYVKYYVSANNTNYKYENSLDKN